MTDKPKKVGRPKLDKPQDKRVTFRMDADTFEKFEDYCKREKVTKSEGIRRAVDLLK
ncbi:TPA: ribbon-helix-helix protein, CopG family [Streptococcus suis]